MSQSKAERPQTVPDLDGDSRISFNFWVPGHYLALPKVQREFARGHSASQDRMPTSGE